MSEKNIPAFPYFREIPEKKLDDVMTIFQPGMTMRQAYKLAALQSGMCPDNSNDARAISLWCGGIAHEMLYEDTEHEEGL
jgi:hypothetical protein